MYATNFLIVVGIIKELLDTKYFSYLTLNGAMCFLQFNASSIRKLNDRSQKNKLQALMTLADRLLVSI